MANDQFNIATDLKVEIRRPTPGSFVLNYSKLNGPDVLQGTATLTWQEIQTEVASLDLERGVDFSDGYYSPIAATGTLRLKTMDNNPDLNKLIYTGLPIRISYRSNPDTAPGFWSINFRGSVLNSTVTYTPGHKYPEITLTLTDDLDRLLNTQITVDYPAQDILDRTAAINATLTDAGLDEFLLEEQFYSSTLFKAINGTFTVGTLVNEMLQLNQGTNAVSYLLADDSRTLRLYSKASWNQVDNILTLTNLAPTDLNEITYASITSSHDNQYIFNQVVVEDDAGEVITSLADSASINLHGLQSLRTTLATNDTTAIATWAAEIIADQRNKVFRNIEINALDSDGKINRFLGKFTLPTLPNPSPIGVIQDFYGFYSETSNYITRITQSITPDAWGITIDTGKGLPSA